MYSMADPTPHPPNAELEELYAIDPELKKHAADLPRLISALTKQQPLVTPNKEFVRTLRASLLAYAPTTKPKPRFFSTPAFWWGVRLAPIGLALVLIVALSPQQTSAPTEPRVPETPLMKDGHDLTPAPTQPGDEQPSEIFSTQDASLELMTTTEATTALVVTPPRASSTLTLTQATLPQSGWMVVYEDAGGAFGSLLHASFLTAGTYTDLSLPLARTLTYPELITVAIYTGTNSTQFNVVNESIQLDPVTETPLLVSVPVVSDLELVPQP